MPRSERSGAGDLNRSAGGDTRERSPKRGIRGYCPDSRRTAHPEHSLNSTVMARFDPFRALRYAPRDDLDAVIAPPYDVLSPAEVATLRARDRHNIAHVDVPDQTTHGYAASAATLAQWRRDGVLVLDDAPSLTIYRMDFADAAGRPRQLVGVLGALEVVDAGAGRVLPHERTTPKASTDRLDLTRATRANLSPVWGLSLASGLSALLAEPAEAVGQLAVDGVTHRVERLTDPDRIAAICALVGGDDVLIADGHHRYGVARAYRDEVLADKAASEMARELTGATLAFVGELTPEQLAIDAIHRLVRGVSITELRELLSRDFVLTPGPSVDDVAPADLLRQLDTEGVLALLTPDGAVTWLSARPGAFDGVRALDGAWLEHTLAGSAASLDYQHGIPETVAALEAQAGTGVAGGASGTGTGTEGAGAAILIRPTSLAEIERTAREGLLMPPKSTFFTPKLRTGFVVRLLDES